MSRKRVLFLQPALKPRGGASAVAAWIVQALKDDFDLTVLTKAPVNWAPFNHYYGTSIRPEEVSILTLHPALRALVRLHPNPCNVHPAAFLMRMCRRIRHQYDLVVCAASEEADLGGPGILYVHYPYLAYVWEKYEDCGGRPLLQQLAALIRGRVRPFMISSGYSLDRMKQNRILVNSDWTGEIFRRSYGTPTETFYPPVTASPERLPWSERENAFVTIGRLTSPKRFEWIAGLIAQLRQRHGDLSLHVAGTREGASDRHYYQRLRRLQRENSSWMRLHEDLSRDELLRLLGRVRYGIHAKVDEHFGIAPAETLMAGCITFVHDSGGQVEIVGRDPRLCFSSQDDAAAKIDRVLTDGDLQSSLLKLVSERSTMFSTESFTRKFRELVRSYEHSAEQPHPEFYQSASTR